MAPEAAPSLADRTHALLFNDKVAGKRLTTVERSIFVRLRSEMRRAQRFVLDDDAVRLVCHLEHEVDRLVHWAPLARLPYIPMWIEFDHLVKLDELRQMGVLGPRAEPPNQIPSHLGFLILRDGEESTSRWIAHQFSRDPENDVVQDLVSYVFDPEADEATPVRGSRLWRSVRLTDRAGFPVVDMRGPNEIIVRASAELLLFGQLALREMPASGTTIVPAMVSAADWAVHRAAAVADPFWDAAVGGRNNVPFSKLLAEQCKEQAGGLRWLVVALAAINALPKDVRPIDPPTTRPRVVGAHVLPYLQRRSITISLPRDERIVRRARRLLDRRARNAPRPWHRVIGHWRVVERGQQLPPFICRHEPEMVEDGLAICRKCEMLVRWIPQHERGDPSIGMVEHPVYRVRGPKRRSARKVGEVTCTS